MGEMKSWTFTQQQRWKQATWLSGAISVQPQVLLPRETPGARLFVHAETLKSTDIQYLIKLVVRILHSCLQTNL